MAELLRANGLDYQLRAVTEAPFTPKAERESPFAMAGFTTTEACNLSCVMCYFNGPKAVRKSRTLNPDQVLKVLRQIPSGGVVWFAGTGDLFMDAHALDHLRAAVSLGHQPAILTHGQLFTPALLDQLLEIGVRTIRMSVDAIDDHHYRRIRRGGQLGTILDSCAYLRAKQGLYPDICIEITNTLFSNTAKRQEEFIEFWSDKVDRVLFNTEYYDIFYFRRIFHQPTQRVNCRISNYVVPSGRIAPCCAMVVYQHDHDVSWLPHIDTHSQEEAYRVLCDMYDDPESQLGQLCKKCDWWILHSPNEQAGGSAYYHQVDLPREDRKPGK
jgi:uncharacterized Fe-S cluster-containing radical SAM superfamily protein